MKIFSNFEFFNLCHKMIFIFIMRRHNECKVFDFDLHGVDLLKLKDFINILGRV